MSAFLRFVVEQSLAGQGAELKEYTVGVAVFGRSEGYDPRLDSIVRVEARRLRTKLDEYYQGDGRLDPVIIRIPRGSYVPTFEGREPAPVASPVFASSRRSGRQPRWAALALLLGAMALALAAWQTFGGAPVGQAARVVSIGVLPFNAHSTDAADARLADELTDVVTSTLARNPALGVASHTSARQFAGGRHALSEIAETLKVDLILEGSVTRAGDEVSVSIRLVDVPTNRKIWVESFTGRAGDLPALAQQIAAAAGQRSEQSRRTP